MERIKGNSDRQQNIEMRRLINDPDAGEEPLEILKQEISVLEEAEHAQIHANAGDQPTLLRVSILRFADLAPKPEIHRRCRKQKRGKRRIPRPVKNVARDYEQIFPDRPGSDAPIGGQDHHKKDNKGERIEEHGWPRLLI